VLDTLFISKHIVTKKIKPTNTAIYFLSNLSVTLTLRSKRIALVAICSDYEYPSIHYRNFYQSTIVFLPWRVFCFNSDQDWNRSRIYLSCTQSRTSKCYSGNEARTCLHTNPVLGIVRQRMNENCSFILDLSSSIASGSVPYI